MQHSGSGSQIVEFPRETEGLPEARTAELIELTDGDEFDLEIRPVKKRIGDATVRMLSYNGSVPGPTLKIEQGSTITVHVSNHGDLDATVHWHGLRLENRYDGTHETQAPIPVGETFTYQVHVPDAGAHWYHPHIREDYGQEMGLYGNILVTPSEPDYWPPANRELLLTPSERVVVDVLFADAGKFELEHRTPERTYRLASIGVADARPEESYADHFAQLRTNADMLGLREHIEPFLEARPDKTLSFVAEMDMGVPEGVPVVYVCTMHPEVVSEEPGSCPKCGMKLLAQAAEQTTYVCPMHPEVTSQKPDRCPKCGMKLLPANLAAGGGDGHEHHHGHDAHGHHDHDHHGEPEHVHDTAQGIEWEDDMIEVNRMTTPA